MEEKPIRHKKTPGVSLLLSIVLVFCILGTVVFSVAQKISREMSASAIQNLSESLDLIQYAIEAILNGGRAGFFLRGKDRWASGFPVLCKLYGSVGLLH